MSDTLNSSDNYPQAMKKADIEKLLEAHVQFELKRYKGKKLEQTIRSTVDWIFDLSKKIRVDEAFDVQQLMGAVMRNLIDFDIPEEPVVFIQDSAKQLYQFIQKDFTQFEALIPKDIYFHTVENLIELRQLREKILAKSVSNPIYSLLISEVLYNGIKEFIISENIFVKKMPGVSSLIKISHHLINSTGSNISEVIDRQLKKFIQKNIEKTIAYSERILNHSLDDELLIQTATELWESVSKKPISAITDYLDQEDIDRFTPIIKDFWLQFRKTDVYREGCERLLSHFLERYSDISVDELLTQFGITPELITTEANELIPRILKTENVQVLLEKRIRLRLKAFYSSKAAKSIFDNLC